MTAQYTGGDVDFANEKGTEPSKEISTTAANVPPPEDPAAPSKEVSSKKQSLSDLFTIFCAGAALISDGYQNSLM